MTKLEQKEQIALHSWCKLNKLVSFSIPNGGTRHMLEAVNLKKEGLTKGVSDYVVILPSKILFIEMKRKRKFLKSGAVSKENLASKEQEAFLKSLEPFDYVEGKVCYGFLEAMTFIKSHM